MLGEATLDWGREIFEGQDQVSAGSWGRSRSGSGNLEEPGRGSRAVTRSLEELGRWWGRVGEGTDARKAEGECLRFLCDAVFKTFHVALLIIAQYRSDGEYVHLKSSTLGKDGHPAGGVWLALPSVRQ